MSENKKGVEEIINAIDLSRNGKEAVLKKAVINRNKLYEALTGVEKVDLVDIIEKLVADNESLKGEIEKLKNQQNETDFFIRNVIHDIRAPLGAVTGYSELMGSGEGFSVDDIKEYANAINNSGVAILEVISGFNSLREHQNMDLKLESIDVKAIVEGVLSNGVRDPAKMKKIELINNVTNKEKVLINEYGLQIVLRNLINNSIKFTPDGGSIKVYDSFDEGHWVLHIKDTGIGMDARQIEEFNKRLFGKTTKGTKNEKGTGFGLSLCTTIVGKMNGEISLDSKKGEGTEFSVKFPFEQLSVN